MVKAGTKFRAPETQVGSLRYSRSLAFEKSAVRMDVRDAGVGIGQLKIERHANNFRVAWQSREGDMATSLARRISTAGEPAAVLAGDARVAASVQTADGEFLVRLRGSSRWLKLAPERAPGADVGQGWHSRVASIDPQAKSINVAWYDDAQVSAALGDRTFVQLPAPSDPSAAYACRWRRGRRRERNPSPFGWAGTISMCCVTAARGRTTHAGRTYLRRFGDARNSSTRTDRAPSLESSAAGDFPSAAEDLARSPRLYKAALDLHFASELKRVDALLASGDDARALSVLDDLAGIHGNTPDVSLRRAMVLTRHAGPARAARTVEDAMPAPIRNHTALFDEINARIRSAATPAEEQDLRNLAAFGDWTDVAQRNALRTGRPILKAEGGALRLEFRAAQRLDGHRVAELPSGDVPLYVQDAPSLANLDSPAAIQQAVHTGVNGRLPVILKVNHDELAYFRPAKIYVPDGQTAFRRIEAGPVRRAPSRDRPTAPTATGPADPRTIDLDAAAPSRRSTSSSIRPDAHRSIKTMSAAGTSSLEHAIGTAESFARNRDWSGALAAYHALLGSAIEVLSGKAQTLRPAHFVAMERFAELAVPLGQVRAATEVLSAMALLSGAAGDE